MNGVAKILLGVAAVIAAWKFGKAAQHVASGWNERLEAQADAIYAYGGGLGADGDDEPTVH